MSDLFLKNYRNDLKKLNIFFFLIMILNFFFIFHDIILIYLNPRRSVINSLVKIYLIAVLIDISLSIIYVVYAKYVNYKMIQSSWFEKSFYLIQKMNTLPFIIMAVSIYQVGEGNISMFDYFIKIPGTIIIGIIYVKSFFDLEKKDPRKELLKSIKLFSFIIFIGIILSLIGNYVVLIGKTIILIGMYLMHKKTFVLFEKGDTLSSYGTSYPIKVQQIFDKISELVKIKIKFMNKPDIKLKEEKSRPEPEIVILKPEIEKKLIIQPDIAIKEEISQPEPEIVNLKTKIETELDEYTELIPEIEITQEKMKTKKRGLLNFKINQKEISENSSRNKIIQKEDISQVPKKECPFCGKKHEDLNVIFCLACGYKF